VKRKKTGFTMIEMLIVLGILLLLVGLLVPALTAVKNVAKETKQKAQFSTIELALASFKNDHGDYPPSDWALPPNPASNYCGAQKLAEALLGWDLLGFHPDTAWRADGLDATGGFGTYDPTKSRDLNGDGIPDTMIERKEPYLELGTASAFKLRDLYRVNVNWNLAPDTYVLCDAFTNKKIMLTATGKTVKAGTPILYYRANTSQQFIRGRYNVQDNEALVLMKWEADGSINNSPHPLIDQTNQYQFFYGTANAVGGMVGYIQDPKIEARSWPYRPDSYLLISAGADGLYGTPDDIRNFGN
jgi:prepilin-type N-terminal cleavage/methylation domain-containing protein